MRIFGIARGELDPARPENQVIADLDKAARNARGMVEYETDFFILRPAESRRPGGVLVYDVTNRGRKVILGRLDEAGGNADTNDPKTAQDVGIGLHTRARLQPRLVGLGFGGAARQQRHDRAAAAGARKRPADGAPHPRRVPYRHPRAGQGRCRAAQLSGRLDRPDQGTADRARPRKRRPHRDPGRCLGVCRQSVDPAVAGRHPVRAGQDLRDLVRGDRIDA